MEYPIGLDYSNPQQGSFSPIKMQNSHPRKVFAVPPTRKDDRKLFVGGLPSNVTDEEFREFFEQFGSVVDSVVMFDRDTHRSRGFGFITFEDPNVSRRLLEMSVEGVGGGGQNGSGRVEMRGKVCEIKPAEPKEASGSAGGKGRRGSKGTTRTMYQQRYPNNVGVGAGYPPPVPQGMVPPGGDAPSVNQGVPSTLPMPDQQPVMYPPYGMGAYYHQQHLPEAMHVYPPYVGYPPQEMYPALYYAAQGNIDQHYGGMPSAMTATAPGPQVQNGAQNGFAPVNPMPSSQAGESGDEAEQTS